MPLAPGIRFGVYEVTSQIGEGSMGQVYQARDTKLNRDVALKILPDAFAGDPDRLARFQREAQVLASLNHANIAHIHGLEESGGVRALVMELVEGEDLSQRIARGPVPLDEALPIAKQIAEALEAAHEQGIIHRDLKPANIKVRPDGMVKVLDFGLAKAMEPIGRAPDVSQSPTITTPAMTQAGVILGTAAYMSPEQAKGRPADKRSDVWAFGCVVYELLARRRAFAGEDVADTLAQILTKEPDWSALPAQTPEAMHRLLRRCLERDRKRRLDSVAAARLDIEEAADGETIPVPSSASGATMRHARVAWITAALAALAAGGAVGAWAPWRTASESAPVVFELQMASPGSVPTFLSMFAISPDGTKVVARVQDGDVPRLAVRLLARVEATTLPHTDGATYPFWAPDGHAIGFFADGKLKTIDLVGTPPQTLAYAPGPAGGTWNGNGVILFAPQLSGTIYQVDAAGGGPAVPATELDTAQGDTSHRFPRFLPDGVHFVYLVRGSGESSGIYGGTLASKETHRLLDTLNKPEFAPPNLLLYVRESTLMAQRVDLSLSRVVGSPFRLIEGVGSHKNTGSASFSVSDNGVLTYRTGFGGDARELAWVDRTGKRVSAIGAPGRYENPRLSPTGQQLAFFKPDNGGDIWVTELERGPTARFTLDPASDNIPVWSPNGTRIAFVSNRDGGIFNIYQKNAGGTGQEELLLKTSHDKRLNDWSPDGRYLLYEEDDPQTKSDLWMLPVTGDRKPSRLLGTEFNEGMAAFSPDGAWIAYTSDESGSRQVYVRKFPTSDIRRQVSNGRAAGNPRWGSNGELFFDVGGTMTAVSTMDGESRSEFRPGASKSLFTGLMNFPHNFDVAERAERFLVLLNAGTLTATGGAPPITVVVNWKSGLSLPR